MSWGDRERIAVKLYINFLKKLEKGSKEVLVSNLNVSFVGQFKYDVDFQGFIYGVFENEESYLVTSIDEVNCVFEKHKMYSVRFTEEINEPLATHFLRIQEN